MASPIVDRHLLTDLEDEAQRVAEQRGHRLSPFSNARHDPLRYVSFCRVCGGLVIVDAAPGEHIAVQRMRGYALESNCPCHRESTAA